MANYLVTDTELTQVANAIRAKSRATGQLAFPVGFVNTIAGITEKAAATYYTSDSDQVIAAGQYLAGAQTIKRQALARYSFSGKKRIYIQGKVSASQRIEPGQIITTPLYMEADILTQLRTALNAQYGAGKWTMVTWYPVFDTVTTDIYLTNTGNKIANLRASLWDFSTSLYKDGYYDSPWVILYNSGSSATVIAPSSTPIRNMYFEVLINALVAYNPS